VTSREVAIGSGVWRERPEPGLAAGRAPGTLKLFRLLLWVQWRMCLARIRGVRRQSPLLLFVLGGFIAAYLGVGYWLFYEGLEYMHRFPLIGTLLSQRILFLIFGFFFLMLTFSNLVVGYSTLFKNRETEWFLTLPIRHADVYRWKFLEALVVSSWALVFLSAPPMAAFGRVHDVQGVFYVEIAAIYLPFVVIPALLGSWGILLLVRFLGKRWVKRAVFALALLLLVGMAFGINPATDADASGHSEVAAFDRLLRHTRMSLNPYLPSAWLATSVLAWSEGLARQGFFFFLVLLSNALMGVLLGFQLFQRLFYGSWSATVSSRAEQFHRRAEAKRRKRSREGVMEWLVRVLPFGGRPVKALVLKDAKLFSRDPAQWTQFMIFFGLLCIYVVNLRNVAFDSHSEFWETMISYLNLTASSLTLSTLTTRFVFPQFSLEGRRLWIIGLAPIGLRRIILQKFWLSCLSTMAVTVCLMTLSSLMLHLPAEKVSLFTGSIAVMSATLSGLAVGLGAVFPNFKEENPSKIVSGFGGTLCLVGSFIYITIFVSLVALPDVAKVIGANARISEGVPFALALLLSAFVLGAPMICAMRRLKNLEF
jgi:ABC-2 type transport system permease protein